MKRRDSLLLISAALLSLGGCVLGDTFQRGGAAVQEGAERGVEGFIDCQKERDKRRLGLVYDPNQCPPVRTNPEGRT